MRRSEISNRKHAPWSNLNSVEERIFPHYTVMENNLQSEPRYKSRERLPFVCSNSTPYIPPNHLQNTGPGYYSSDPSSSLVHRKAYWSSQIRWLSKRNKQYNETYTSFSDSILAGLTEVSMPNYEANFFQLLSQDPDVDFSGVTNWYYTGGRLDQVDVNDQKILFTTTGINNEQLRGIPLKLECEKGWTPCVEESITLKPLDNDVIYQVIGKQSECVSLVAIRQKKTCTLYTIEPTETCLRIQGQHQATGVKPFTSLDINQDNIGHYCTSSTNRQISIFDVSASTCTQSVLVEKPKYDLSSPWCSVKYLDQHMLLMVDSCSLSFLDTRENLQKPSLVFYPNDQPSILNSCEDIAHAFQNSCYPSNFYVATSHHLLEMDVRVLKTSQRWTHMLRSPPIYSQAVYTKESEIVFIANQEPAEVEVVVNDLNAQSTTLPRLLPSLQETLQMCHMKGCFLDPRVQKRMKASITGLLVLPLKESGHVQVLTQTSFGDIFTQELKFNQPSSNIMPDVDSLLEWEKQVLNANTPTMIKISARKPCSNIYKSLSKPESCHPPFQKQTSKPKILQTSKSELLSYTDVLAADLLSVWDINKMPEFEHEENEIVNDSDNDSDRDLFADADEPSEQIETVCVAQDDTARENCTIDSSLNNSSFQKQDFPTSSTVLVKNESNSEPLDVQTDKNNASQVTPTINRNKLSITPMRKSNVLGF